MKNCTALAFVAVILAGCETTGGEQSEFKVESLPEYAQYQSCLGRQAAIYSRTQGSPLELGIIASAACNRARATLYDALARARSPAYARSFISISEREDPKMIAGVIAKVKAGQDPF